VGDRRAKQADYDNVDVIPVSDPNAATMSQKVVQYQAVMQMAQANPQIYDLPELNRQMLEVLGIKNIGKLIPSTEDQKPKDPVSENMAVINGKPVKAFIYQDHQAHIAVHMAAMQDPKIMQMIGQNPMASQIQAAAMAHINEHIAFEYRKQIEEQLGVPLPNPDENLPEDVEVQLSRLTADAANKLLQKDQAEVQQQQIEQQQQDPLIQMQQQELQIKQQEVQIKQQESQAKIQEGQAKIQIEQQKLEFEKSKAENEQKLNAMEMTAKVTMDKKKLESQQSLDGVKIGLDAAIQKEQLGIQKDNKQPRE
jgi:hypothetical protein